MDRSQRMLMLALPLVFVAFIIRFPAGLMVYWITTNCWTIVQQLIVRRTVGVPRRPALATAGAPAGAAALTGGRSGRSGGDSGGKGAAAKASDKGAAAAKVQARPGENGAAAAGPPPTRRKKKRTGRRR
jgi:YidC/Oxa1 family membrane protein insertase